MQLDISYRKDTYAARKLVSYFLRFDVGDKIATVTELSGLLKISRGTIQNAIKMLQDYAAISLESRGHLGTFIKHMNLKTLLAFSGITSVVGSMPLPYTKRYQGLATGILRGMENDCEIEVNMAYIRGSKKRIDLLVEKRFDFCVTSKLSALECIDGGYDIKIAYEFGDTSYSNEHAVIFADNNQDKITDGMRIGIDRQSIDQMNMTKTACEGKNVEYVNVTYNQSLQLLKKRTIDAIVWNSDEVIDTGFNYVPVDSSKKDGNKAVVLVSNEREEIIYLLKHIFRDDTVEEIQAKVMNDEEITVN